MSYFKVSKPSNEEKRLAEALQRRKHEFRQNQIIEGYEVDFWFPKVGFIIEIDGFSHLSDLRQQSDQRKDLVLSNAGYIVMRFNNQQIREELNKCVQIIEEQIGLIIRLKKSSNINDQWKLKLQNIKVKETETKKTPKTIEEIFLDREGELE